MFLVEREGIRRAKFPANSRLGRRGERTGNGEGFLREESSRVNERIGGHSERRRNSESDRSGEGIVTGRDLKIIMDSASNEALSGREGQEAMCMSCRRGQTGTSAERRRSIEVSGIEIKTGYVKRVGG